MNYKKAKDIFEGGDWNERQSALFYYKWFGEEFMFDMIKEGIENNKKEFSKLVNIKAAKGFKQLRYDIYEIEKESFKKISALSNSR